MSARRRTEGERHARRVLCALARTALDVCDLRAEAGLEDDDRPRMWLVSMERWARGEEPPAMLGARSRDFVAWREKGLGTSWTWALFCLADAVSDVRRRPTHVELQVRWVTLSTGYALAAIRSEGVTTTTVAEAHARVREIYARHLRDVEREAVARLLGTVRP